VKEYLLAENDICGHVCGRKAVELVKQAGLASSQDTQSAVTPSSSPRPRLESGLEQWGEEGKTAVTSPNNSHSSSLWTGPSHTQKRQEDEDLELYNTLQSMPVYYDDISGTDDKVSMCFLFLQENLTMGEW